MRWLQDYQDGKFHFPYVASGPAIITKFSSIWLYCSTNGMFINAKLSTTRLEFKKYLQNTGAVSSAVVERTIDGKRHSGMMVVNQMAIKHRLKN